MRILLAAHQFFPHRQAGTEVLTRDVGLELARRRHEVHVLTVDSDPDGVSAEVSARDYEYAGLRVHALRIPPASPPASGYLREYRHEALSPDLHEYVSGLRPDAIHAFHLMGLSATAVDAFAAAGAPMIFTATDFWSFCYRSTLARRDGSLCGGPAPDGSNCLECRKAEQWFPPRVGVGHASARYYRSLARKAMSAPRPGEYPRVTLARPVVERTPYMRRQVERFDRILAPTRLTERLLLDNGFARERIAYSPYGMDVSALESARASRGEPGEPSPGLRVGFIGTLAEHKGLHVLVEAFRGLDAPGATLRISGPLGMVPEYLRRILADVAHDRRVNVAGAFDNARIADELRRIDVLVVPSTWYENAPLVALSAQAAGVPVVATDLGGLAEIVAEGENGLLFGRGDVASLRSQLERLVREPGLLRSLSDGTRPPRPVGDAVDEYLQLYAPGG